MSFVKATEMFPDVSTTTSTTTTTTTNNNLWQSLGLFKISHKILVKLYQR